jgi:hypothetical protein
LDDGTRIIIGIFTDDGDGAIYDGKKRSDASSEYMSLVSDHQDEAYAVGIRGTFSGAESDRIEFSHGKDSF